MRHCTQYIILIMISFFTLGSQGCSSKDFPSKQSRGKFRMNIQRDPSTLDPRRGGDVVSSHLHFMISEGLTRLDENNETSPAQAQSIDLSADGTTYTFHLRDCKWSDGTPILAEDYEYSWKTILSPSFPAINAHLLYSIKNAEKAKKGLVPPDEIGVKAIDEKTLVVQLEKPTPYFLQLTSFCVLFPIKKSLDLTDPDWIYRTDSTFVSNGPFSLKNWKHKDELVIERNPFYWEKDEVTIDEIQMSIIDNESTALQMFEKGLLDIIGAPLSPIPIDALRTYKNNDNLSIYPTAGSTFIAFNTDQFPFHNRNMRKAFSLALNRTAIIENITQLEEEIALSTIPSVMKNGRKSAFYKDHDIELAKKYLERGLKELNIKASDLSLTYNYVQTEIYHKVAQAIQQQWKDVLGITVNLENLESKVLIDKLSKRNYTFAQTIWMAQYNDPMNILERYKLKENLKNYASWYNENYSHLLDQSFYVQNAGERASVLEAAEKIFMEEFPICPIYHWKFAVMVQPHVKIALSPIGDIYFSKICVQNNEQNL